nr:hypothetical protein FFPRI1PSEUD_24330 [Pseudomonas sp. FFPRI_1]
MATQTVQLLLMEGRHLRQTLSLRPGAKGFDLKIKAGTEGRFVLIDQETGYAPQKIRMRRIGKHLLVCLKGDSLEEPTVVIEDFFLHHTELFGMGAGNSHHAYTRLEHKNAYELTNSEFSIPAQHLTARGNFQRPTFFGLPLWAGNPGSNTHECCSSQK